MRYLLDTHAVITLLNDLAGPLARRVRQHQPTDIGLPAIVIHELYFAAFKSQRHSSNTALVDGLKFEVLQFDREDARQLGEIRATLAASGMPIGSLRCVDRRASPGPRPSAGIP